MRVLSVTIAAAVTAVTVLAADRPDAGGITTIYRLDSYTAKPGRIDDLHAWFRAHRDDVLARHGAESIACLVPTDEKPGDRKRLLVITRYPTQQALIEYCRKVSADPLWQPIDATTDTPERLVEMVDTTLGTPTDYSPDFMPRQSPRPRVFELRTYTCPSSEKLNRLHDRFRSHTMKLFAKHGMENLVYWQPLVWRPQNTEDIRWRLVYLLGHESQEAAGESFAAFRSDPAWLTAKRESEEQAGGPLTNADGGVVSEFFIPTEYSPLR